MGVMLVGDAWFSTLMPAAAVVTHTPSGVCYLSLGGHGSGFLTWMLVECHEAGGPRLWKLDLSADNPVQWEFVTVPTEWAFVVGSWGVNVAAAMPECGPARPGANRCTRVA